VPWKDRYNMEVAAVKLRNSYQICYVDINSIFIKQNSSCVIETEAGLDIGTILKSTNFTKNHKNDVTGKVIRLANAKDQETLEELEKTEEKAFQTCREKAAEKKLMMKLVSVKSLLDRTKLIFYFVAENRVDFRDLVRELASVYKTRIEMRQIGVRDEARMVGGYGPCGIKQCCSSMKVDFDPVSIKMAKEQNLNLNSLKISGMCGRLLCCLGYEYETYRALNAGMPRLGTEITTEKQKYTVIAADTLKQEVTIRSGDRILNVSRNDLQQKGRKYSLKEEIIEKILHHDDEDEMDDEYIIH
jgi:cell fate regulator YaaT (PSP1 superfamily)